MIIISKQDKIVPKENIKKFYNILKQDRHSESITECHIISQCDHLTQERPDELIVLKINQHLGLIKLFLYSMVYKGHHINVNK